MGCHFLLQGIFPTQKSNLCLRRWTVYHWITREAMFTHTCALIHQRLEKEKGNKCFSFFYLPIVQLSLLPIHPCGQEEMVAANRLLHILWGPNCCSVAKSCPTLCDSIDCSPPGSSVHGILQSRIVEWVAISFSRGSNKRSYICFWDMCAKHIMMFWSLFER